MRGSSTVLPDCAAIRCASLVPLSAPLVALAGPPGRVAAPYDGPPVAAQDRRLGEQNALFHYRTHQYLREAVLPVPMGIRIGLNTPFPSVELEQLDLLAQNAIDNPTCAASVK